MKQKTYKPGATESQVLAQVVEAAAMFGITLERRNTGAGLNPAGKMVRFGTKGDSDLLGTVTHGPNRGRTIAVEVKREGWVPPVRGKPMVHFINQIKRMQKVNEDGGLAFWVNSGSDAAAAFRHIATTPIHQIVFYGYYPYIEMDPTGGLGDG